MIIYGQMIIYGLKSTVMIEKIVFYMSKNMLFLPFNIIEYTFHQYKNLYLVHFQQHIEIAMNCLGENYAIFL